MSSLPELLKASLQTYGISAVALCDASGVHRSRISDIIKGKVDPRWSTVVALLDGLEKLAPGARLSLCMHLSSPSLVPASVNAIETMNPVDLSILLGLILSRLQAKTPTLLNPPEQRTKRPYCKRKLATAINV